MDLSWIQIITEITTIAANIFKEAVQESLKRTLKQEFFDKKTDEAAKRLKRFTIAELKNKKKKIRFEANNTIFERIGEVIKTTEGGNVDRYQEKLQEGKKLLLKQQKLIRISVREEDG